MAKASGTSKNLFTGWRDPDLTDKGVAEATRAGQLLKDKGLQFDIAFTSVLTARQHTLDIILGRARPDRPRDSPATRL